MFRWLGRREKDPLSSLFGAPALEFCQAVLGMIADSDDASRAFCLVARVNVPAMISAITEVHVQRGTSYSVRDFVLELSRQQQSAKDTVNESRYGWYLLGGMILEAESRSRQSPILSDICGEVWVLLAKASPSLKRLLPKNAVWKAEEKAYFDLMMSGDDDDLVASVVNNFMPSQFWPAKAVAALAEEKGFLYRPGAKSPLFGPLVRLRPR